MTKGLNNRLGKTSELLLAGTRIKDFKVGKWNATAEKLKIIFSRKTSSKLPHQSVVKFVPAEQL